MQLDGSDDHGTAVGHARELMASTLLKNLNSSRCTSKLTCKNIQSDISSD